MAIEILPSRRNRKSYGYRELSLRHYWTNHMGFISESFDQIVDSTFTINVVNKRSSLCSEIYSFFHYYKCRFDKNSRFDVIIGDICLSSFNTKHFTNIDERYVEIDNWFVSISWFNMKERLVDQNGYFMTVILKN